MAMRSDGGSAQSHAQVLVVDDTKSLAVVISRFLTTDRIKCKTAFSLGDAMQMLDGCKILITDFDLNESGSENSLPLVKKAKELGIYVIQMSGDIERAKETITMADTYISKFPDEFKFRDIIREVKFQLERLEKK